MPEPVNEWFTTPGSDIERRAGYNDRGEFIGFYERLRSSWPDPADPGPTDA